MPGRSRGRGGPGSSEKEVDAQRINEADWSRLATREFDRARLFSANNRTLAVERRYIDGSETPSGTLPREISIDASHLVFSRFGVPT